MQCAELQGIPVPSTLGSSLGRPFPRFIFGSPLIRRWSNIGLMPRLKKVGNIRHWLPRNVFWSHLLPTSCRVISFEQLLGFFFSRLCSQVVDLNGYTVWLIWLQVMNFVSFALGCSVEDLFDDDDDQRFLFYLQRENKFFGNRILASMPLDSTLVPCSINNFIASFNLRHFVIPSKTCCSYWLVC